MRTSVAPWATKSGMSGKYGDDSGSSTRWLLLTSPVALVGIGAVVVELVVDGALKFR